MHERVHAENAQQWRGWLTHHHETATGAWLVSWKKRTGGPAMSYDEAVPQAVAFGWVDSLPAKLDDDRTMLYFCPRRRGSGWSRPNKQRVAALEAAGLMAPAGLSVVEQARADGSWTMLDDVEDLLVPPDLADAFAAVDGSRDRWDAFPPSARRGILEWIVQARRPSTRARRVQETAHRAGRGERANQWVPKAKRR